MPSNLVGTGVSSSQINLTWTASTDNVGVTGYQVFRNSLLIGTAGTPSFTDTGLTPSTTYTYTVTALDAALNTSAPSTAVAVTTQAAGLSALASDNFDRPNGGPGANWTVIDSDPRIVNQHLQETNTTDGNDSIAIYTALTWPADQYSQLTVQAATSHSGCAAIVRTKNDPVIEMYFVYVVGPLGPRAQLVLAKFVRHVYAELWSSVLPVNAGDVVYLSASGTTLTVKLNGTTLTTQTDGSITAAGYPGIDVTDYDGRGAPGDGQCDNWEGGAVGNLLAAPTNLAGTAVSSSQVNLSWTASTGAAGYKVFRNGTQAGSSVTTSYSDSGLTLGTTYTYAVAAYASDGTTSPLSAPIAVTTQGDTTPPSAPTGLAGTAISSSQINLTWTASTDNVGVASYKVFRNGSQIGTSGTPSFADSGLLASTTYTYGVSATDLAGNPSALSVPTSVTTNGATPSIPIVAFAFDEATGSIANDASGNGNQGTLINGPTWSAGHSGSAVSFDGINDYVSAGNIAALNGLTAVTVSTWIKGSVGASSPDAIIVAKDAAFALVVSDGVPHKAQFGVKSGNTWYGFPSSTTSVDDGAFHFVTGVYDGATVRVYVDGVQQGSSSVGARTLTAPSTSLQVASCLGGPNCDSSGEMWHGLVDDVRVYNRALTASEIVTDMNNAVH
jgi:chitodextrinase